MTALRSEQLEPHLARELRPLYVIHGDEPLLALEAADAIRARARAAGFSERVVLAAEPDGKVRLEASGTADAPRAVDLGTDVAAQLIARGASEWIRKSRQDG